MKKKLLLLHLLAVTFFANAQNVGIGTTTPLARLHVKDSSVLFSATGGASVTPGNSPISGEGRRMMWYSDKAAFRAGYVENDQWNQINIGNYSFASGINTIASANYSTAMGSNTIASHSASTAMGYFTTASGYISTAMGFSTIASAQASTAMGNGTTASSDASTAMGESTTASGRASTAMGVNTTASGYSSTAMGYGTTAKSGYETVLGRWNTDYTPISATIWNAADRLFVIGNGTGTGASSSNAMTVLKNGNVGIGTSTPNALLQLSNYTANRKIVLYDANNNDNQYYGFGINGGMLRYQIDAIAAEHAFYAGTGIGASNWLFSMHGDGNAFCSGTLTQYSDARLKTNIVPIGASLEKLMQLNGYSFNWISQNKDQRQQIGLLAQEVQKLFPQLATEIKGDNDENILGINYIGLIPVLIESIKEQQKQIDALSAHDTEQQKQIDELKSM